MAGWKQEGAPLAGGGREAPPSRPGVRGFAGRLRSFTPFFRWPRSSALRPADWARDFVVFF